MFEVPGEYKVRDESDAAITEFSEKYENALGPLLHWYHLAKRAQWTSLAEVRKDFRHADVVGVFTVFNIAGMETNIGSSPRSNTVGRCSTSGNIRYVLTHGEYDKEKWNRFDERKYQRLLGEALPVVVRTEREYRRLLRSTEQLMEKPEETITEEEGRLLELLGVLVEEYSIVCILCGRHSLIRCWPMCSGGWR